MRRNLLRVLVPVALFSTLAVNAQNDRFAYAITDMNKEGSSWTALRKLDLQTGQYSDLVFDGTNMKAIAFDASSRRQVDQKADPKWGSLIEMPFSNGVAAAAYDREHNRLYYTPMFVDQLRYIDLRTMKLYYVTGQAFTGAGNMHNDEAKVITRMVIAPDGYGYAISNDGNTFIRFSTGKRTTIEQLGALVDDPSNSGISVHNRCSSFGGDMISDDLGNLFILTAPNHVFKVNVKTKVATHLGYIQNLPPTFTVNGAAVDANGNLLVSSAVDGNSYYIVDPKTWTAKAFTAVAGVYKSSDLANSNYLSSTARTTTNVPLMTRTEEKFSKQISVYPNPVTVNQMTLQFSKVPLGDYTIELTDVLGRSVMKKLITVASEMQSQVIPMDASNSKGVYMVKVYDGDKQSVFTQKVVVQ
jgi:hypothetical protein